MKLMERGTRVTRAFRTDERHGMPCPLPCPACGEDCTVETGTVAGTAPGYEDEVLVRWDHIDGLSYEYPEQLRVLDDEEARVAEHEAGGPEHAAWCGGPEAHRDGGGDDQTAGAG